MSVVRCLMIDDDDDDREIFEIALGDCGRPFSFTGAGSGTEGIQILKDGVLIPDFIFLDLNMPILSGKECLLILKQTEPFKNIPVVIYSTSSYYKDIDDTRELGASYFLTKSANIDSLSKTLGEIFTGKQLPFVLAQT